MVDFTFNPFTGELESTEGTSCSSSDVGSTKITYSDEIKEANEVVLCTLNAILNELKIMNAHLSQITDEEKTLDDL